MSASLKVKTMAWFLPCLYNDTPSLKQKDKIMETLTVSLAISYAE